MRAAGVIATAAAGMCLIAQVRAQPGPDPLPEPSQAVAERVRAGGWFTTLTPHRGEDGALVVYRPTNPRQGAFEPLFGANPFTLEGMNAFAWLQVICHGPGDLLGMTDVALHFSALSSSTSDGRLRLLLVLPPPSFDGAQGRAELLDRLLAIDVLVHRGCKPAAVQLRELAKNDLRPARLREHARRAAAILAGTAAPIARRRLDPATVRLPMAFDGCIVVDHSRLPDLTWLPPIARRAEATRQTARLAHILREMSLVDTHQAQRRCDAPSELPFELVRRYGNVRLDHSCVFVTLKADGDLPVALTWEAAGEFEHEGWHRAQFPATVSRAGSLTMSADHLFVSTDVSQSKPRPELAAEIGICKDDGIAIRAVVPAKSNLWPALAFLKSPPANSAELRIVPGDPTVIVLAVDARDEDTAAEWIEAGKRWCSELRAAREHWPDDIRQCKELAAVLDAVLNPAFSTKGNSAFAVIELRGITREKTQEMLLALAPHAW